ncbi:MAG: carboxypeptidase regulatory-like domain-containing protein [Thermoplasmata archaeon]
MDPDGKGWWARHGWTVALLLAAFGIAFALRTIWNLPLLTQFGNLYVYGGGSDSYYHSRVMQYIIANHTNLIFDPLLNYPIGAINPREPLFDWMNAALGIAFAPFFGGHADAAGAFFLNLQAPLWAALSVFPIYLIGREVGDRRTGIIAGFIFAFLPATVVESVFGYGNYLSFYTFVILVVIYSYIRMVKAIGTRRWVDSYRHPRSIVAGLRGLWRTERTGIKWAVFTGVAFGALALSWQGYTFAIAVIGVFIVAAMIIERIRRVDSFGLYIGTWIVGLVGFPIGMPYYYVQQQFIGWFELPLILYFGILALLLPFLLMRDIPWVVSIPGLVAIYLAGAFALFVLRPVYLTEILTGQGYFVKTLIYSTVAEAQAPSFDSLAISYGVVTFFLAFVGLALYGWQMVRSRFPRWLVFFLVFAIVSVYLPISASKFFLVGSPAFAILSAEAVRRLWDLAGFSELRQGVRSLADTRSRLTALRRSFKARHVLVVLVVVGLLLPNIWYGMDAAIPGNTKAGISDQVYNTLPSWLRPASSQASSFYFGATGSSLDTPNLYDSAGYNWLAQQDTAIPQPERPAVISWWDYGFQTIDQGQHPSVADNFQNGIDPAGQFLLAQNQSIAIGVLSATLLEAMLVKNHSSSIPPNLAAILASDGVNVTRLNHDLSNGSSDWAQVVANPQIYLPVNPSTLTDKNAIYMVTSYYLATLSPFAVARVYNDLMAYTGWSIRYAMTDSRLIPFSGTSTGIYYAPADLTGRIIDSAGNPETYFNVTVLGSDGKYYPEGQLPASVSAVQYYVNYFSPFYNSMIYHIYFGYNGTDIGLGTGIPGLLGSLVNYTVEPGWMLSHFMVVYQTAYYCPNPAQAANQNCYSATNKPTALALAKSQGGVANTNMSAYFSGGESMLVYYPGQPMTGTITLPDGTPVAGARVTVTDQWGIPHQTVITGPQGQYSLLLPPGNDTVNVTIGTLQGLSQQGNILLTSVPVQVPNAVGFSIQAPTLVRTIVVPRSTVSGMVYWNLANSSSYAPILDPPVSGATVRLWGVANATPITVTTDAGGTFSLPDVPPGIYNYSVLYQGANFTQPTLYVDPGSSPINASAGLTPSNVTGVVLGQNGLPIAGARVTVQGANGVDVSTTTGASGSYQLQSFGPGNYTMTAVGPANGERSMGVPLYVSGFGEKMTVNLTEQPMVPVRLTVTEGGLAAPGVAVRLTEVPTLNATTSVTNLTEALARAAVFTTDASGAIQAYLPAGTYSVYASTLSGSSPMAALGTVAVSPDGPPVSAGPLALAPASWLRGTILTKQPNATTAVLIYGDDGGSLLTGAPNGTIAALLPAGNYTALALQSTLVGTGPIDAALAPVSLASGGASLSVALVPAVRATIEVGVPRSDGTLLPAAGATVTLGIDGTSAEIPSQADAEGSVTFLAPASLGPSQSYCLSASGTGYLSAQECGIAPGSLPSTTQLSLRFAPIPATILVTGAPPGVAASVFLNGTSPSAGTYRISVVGSGSLTVNPGNYTVTAVAPGVPGRVVYRNLSPAGLAVPLGAATASVSLVLQRQVNATGTIAVPAGIDAANATIALTGPTNITVNGTAFRGGFWAAPGQYSAHATVPGPGGQTLVNLTAITIASQGTVTPAVRLSAPGVAVTGRLVGPNGTVVAASVPVHFVAPDGATATATSASGLFSLVLPGGIAYGVTVAPTMVPTPGPNGTYLVRWVQATEGATCAVGAYPTNCSVVMTGTTQLVPFAGTVVAGGAPGALPATLTLEGPYPSATMVSIPASNGTFSTSLLPGSYALYATALSTGSPLTNLTAVTVLPGTGPWTVHLEPGWTDTVRILPPSAFGIPSGTASLTVSSASGAHWSIPAVPLSTDLPLALPIGSYRFVATANGTPYGLPAPAAASGSATLAGGNLATALPLSWSFPVAVSARASGPSVVDLPASGGIVRFGVTVSNAGPSPERLSLSISPAYWNVTTSLTNVTVGVGPQGNTTFGVVTLVVPAGTLVDHPPLLVDVVNPVNGSVLATVQGTPTVTIAPSYGVSLAYATGPSQVGSTRILVPFTVRNTGNVPEGVGARVVNATALAGLGWQASVLTPEKSGAVPIIPAGATETFELNLTALGPALIPPTQGVVEISVLNATGAVQQSLTLTIPSATVAVPAPFRVAGPSLGPVPSVLPEPVLILLALIPAIAVAVGVAVYRWNRTRRWQRT